MSSSARSELSLSCTLAMPLEMFLSVAMVTRRLLVTSAIAGQRCSLWGVEPRCLHAKSEYIRNIKEMDALHTYAHYATRYAISICL